MSRLGIHTHIVSEVDHYKNHVSISYVNDANEETFYGLYPGGAQEVRGPEFYRSSNFGGSDLRVNIDKNRPATYSHYENLNPEQDAAFHLWLKQHRHQYETVTNHCADLAMNVWEHVMGQTIDATQIGRDNRGEAIFEQTPIGLENYLRELDKAPSRTPLTPPEEIEQSPLSESEQAKKTEHQAKEARYRSAARDRLWHEPERLAEEIQQLTESELTIFATLSADDQATQIAAMKEETAIDVYAGRAELRWTTRDMAYFQYLDERIEKSDRVPRLWNFDELSPAMQLRAENKPKAEARAALEAAWSASRRQENQPGSHIKPAGHDRSHEHERRAGEPRPEETIETTAEGGLMNLFRQGLQKIRSWLGEDHGGIKIASITAFFLGRDTKDDDGLGRTDSDDRTIAGNLDEKDSGELQKTDRDSEKAWDAEQLRLEEELEEEFEKDYAAHVAEEKAEWDRERDQQKKRAAYEESEIAAGRGQWEDDTYRFMNGMADSPVAASLYEDRIADEARRAGLHPDVYEEGNPSHVRSEFKPKTVTGISSGVDRGHKGDISVAFDPEKNLLSSDTTPIAKPKREEYTKGSYVRPPQEVARDKDDKDGRGD